MKGTKSVDFGDIVLRRARWVATEPSAVGHSGSEPLAMSSFRGAEITQGVDVAHQESQMKRRTLANPRLISVLSCGRPCRRGLGSIRITDQHKCRPEVGMVIRP